MHIHIHIISISISYPYPYHFQICSKTSFLVLVVCFIHVHKSGVHGLRRPLYSGRRNWRRLEVHFQSAVFFLEADGPQAGGQALAWGLTVAGQSRKNSFARYSFESYKVAGQHPGLKSIDLLGTAKGHGICRLALGVAAECFFVGACLFLKNVVSSSDWFVSWTFVLLSSDCFNRRWEGNGDKLQLWSPWGEGGGRGRQN